MLLSKSEFGEDSNMSPEMQQTFHLKHLNHKSFYLQKFRLYETRSNFYMIGQDKSGSVQRVLKINRLEPSELNIIEDSTKYSEVECCELLKRINDGNKSTGGLKFVTVCYGIVGFVKFLGPYYMLLITRRRKIGVICGHAIYAVTKSKMISIPNSNVQSNMAYSKNENRSFVNSACKCNISPVPLRREKMFKFQSRCILLRIIFRCVCFHFYLVQLTMATYLPFVIFIGIRTSGCGCGHQTDHMINALIFCLDQDKI